MIEFTLPADELYYGSKPLFYKLIPKCIVSFSTDGAYMQVDFSAAAKEQTKTKRRKLIALALAYCGEEDIDRFKEWLKDYFNSTMQHDIFDLSITFDGKIKPDEMLEKALNKINKRSN